MATRKLYKELLHTIIAKGSSKSATTSSNKIAPAIQQHPLVRYISNEFKRHQATQEINCKAQNEASYLASTYLGYLTSCQKHQTLIDTYGSKGERTAKQAARLVGLDVPDTPNH